VIRAPLAAPLAALLTALFLAVAPRPASATDFAAGSARLLDPGRFEVGVFGSLRYGLTDRVELSTHPLWLFVAPNVEAKIRWGAPAAFEVASTHALLYPTPLMRLLAREGTGGLLPPDVTWPQLVATTHRLLVSREVAGHLVTANAGVRLAKNLTDWDGPKAWSQIEWHLAWPRTAAWFTGFSAEVGLGARGPLWKKLGYEAEVEAFLLPGMNGDRAAEWSALLTLQPRPGLQVRGGVKWSWAELPYGTRTSLPFPMVDVLWAFGGR
jgi:hypothetical protein